MEILLVSNDNLNKFKDFAKESALLNKAVHGGFVEFAKANRKCYEAGLLFDFAMGHVYASDGHMIYPTNNSNIGTSVTSENDISNILVYVNDVPIVNILMSVNDNFKDVIKEALECIVETGKEVYQQNKTANDNYSLIMQEVSDYCTKQKGTTVAMSALSDMSKVAEKALNENPVTRGYNENSAQNLVAGFRNAVEKAGQEISEELTAVEEEVKIPDNKIKEIVDRFYNIELSSIIEDKAQFENKVVEIARWLEMMAMNCTNIFEVGLTFNSNDVVTAYKFEIMPDNSIAKKGSVPFEAFMNEFKRMVISDDVTSRYGVGICSIFQKEREPLIIAEFSDESQSIDTVRDYCVLVFDVTLEIIDALANNL